MNENVAAFVMRLFHARTDAHIMHLQTKSYATHVALGDFYKGLIDLVDSYVEAYQGLYGIITEYPDGYTVPSEDPLTEIRDLGQTVDSMREDLPQDSELQNIVDEIAALIDSTVYRLRFLK